MHEVISRWSETAPYWEKHRAVIREMFAPVTQALIEAARITRGSAVLDLATGPGEPALAIAEFVGTAGRVLGVDPVPEMVEAARREANRRGLGNASFAVAQADALPAEKGSFDAVVSRFGVMFFPAPTDAIREMLRVLKPGGRIALAVWSYAERNPFHYVLSRVVERYVSSPPPAADAPDAFRYAEPGKLKAVLSEAGAAAVSERVLQFTVRATASLEQFYTLRTEMSESLRNKLAKIPQHQMAELKRETLEALRPYSDDHAVTMPAEVLIVTGAKPS
jgi:ubiquinone/menaquinone biosynthesis C-methylase UbiE